MSSPTQRSLSLLRERGYQAEIVERWNPFAKVRQDLFGFIDIIAVGNGHTIAVQTTSKSNMSARHHKIVDSPNYPEVLRSGWKVVIHGWAKNKSNRWEVKELELS
jgi:hypothetical protein